MILGGLRIRARIRWNNPLTRTDRDVLRLLPTWPADRAVVDGFGDLSIRDITGLFTAVGFSSPPSWIKPYSVLSGGERFRCDLARALSAGYTQKGTPHPLVASGFLSVGCMPCTSRTSPDEDTRAGRWRGRPKTECGIHTVQTS